MTYHIILLRHGESEWNKENKFCGWTDLHLSDKGKKEAQNAGELLAKFPHQPKAVFTSKLTRAIQTANIVLETTNRLWTDITHTWHLNERHYGALQGRNKDDILKKYGEEKYMLWRRSFNVAPPPIDPEDEYSQVHDERYQDMPHVPLTESLSDMGDRIMPFLNNTILPTLKERKCVLVVGHGNSLRGLVRLIRHVSNEDIKKLDLVTGKPFYIELDENMMPVDSDHWWTYIN